MGWKQWEQLQDAWGGEKEGALGDSMVGRHLEKQMRRRILEVSAMPTV